MVTEVLWRLFRKRARSLACTIESPLPSSISSLVGDDVMLYLLKYPSIFLPVPCKKHYQVSGSSKKRALVDGANSMLEIQKFSRDCVGSNVRRCSISFSWLHGNKRSRTSLLEGESKKNVPEKSHGFNTAYCKETEPQFEANTCYCLRSQVVSFVWAVIRSIVPTELLGTPNWRMLRRNIAQFIQLRRFEKRLDDAAYDLRHKLLENWIFWLFSCLVVPLVRANLYVTETEHGNQDIYYYRKSVWEKMINNAITCLKDQGYRDLDDVTVRNIMKNRKFGFSKLRLRPKGNDMRMLANLKASSRMPTQKSSLENQSCGMHGKGKPCPKKVKFNQFKSLYIVLRDTHAVLKGIKLEEPEKLGSSVFDYNDVYRKLCPFLIGLKNRLDKLLTVMKDILQKDEYLLKESHQVVCTQKSLWVHKNLVLMDQNMSTPKVTSSVPYRLLHSLC
uniref:Telomerase reverse transcriptase n=1 Tax=Quercus lobata TaxID=97700 RepID=A0A7N2LQS5_QUELO